MKKHLLSALLAVALLVTVCVFAVNATIHPADWCDHCNQVVTQWQPLTQTGGTLESGHYYLDGPYTTQTATLKVAADSTVCIDLRGNTWNTEDIRVLEVKARSR